MEICELPTLAPTLKPTPTPFDHGYPTNASANISTIISSAPFSPKHVTIIAATLKLIPILQL